MHVLVPCKNEDDPIKNEGTQVFTTFLPLYVYGEFFRRSRAANSAVPGPIRHYLEQSKMKELECSQHYTLIFQMPKGSLLHNLGYCRNLKSSNLSCMSLLPAKMKIQLKMTALECIQDFRTHPRYYGCPCYLQVRRRSDQK